MTPEFGQAESAPIAVRVAGTLLLGVLTVAVLAPWLAPYDPQQMFDAARWRSHGATAAHLMGTDPYARDILSRLMVGARVSLTLAVATVLISTVVGTAIGLLSGYVGGWLDRLLMRLVDAGLSLPRVLIVLTVVGVLGAPSLTGLVMLLASTDWLPVARLVRGEIVGIRGHDRLVAARALGAGHVAIVTRHLLPDLLPLLAVTSTLAIGQVLLLESGLSFLGVGVQVPLASWGTVLLDVSDVVGSARWLAVGPGLVLVMTVMAIHRLGDALADQHRARRQSHGRRHVS